MLDFNVYKQLTFISDFLQIDFWKYNYWLKEHEHFQNSSYCQIAFQKGYTILHYLQHSCREFISLDSCHQSIRENDPSMLYSVMTYNYICHIASDLALAQINNNRLYFILAFRNKQVLSFLGLNEKGTHGSMYKTHNPQNMTHKIPDTYVPYILNVISTHKYIGGRQ